MKKFNKNTVYATTANKTKHGFIHTIKPVKTYAEYNPEIAISSIEIANLLNMPHAKVVNAIKHFIKYHVFHDKFGSAKKPPLQKIEVDGKLKNAYIIFNDNKEAANKLFALLNNGLIPAFNKN
jgi:23S rRNA maturation-related 3'-5' exoribonuclease YhaM